MKRIRSLPFAAALCCGGLALPTAAWAVISAGSDSFAGAPVISTYNDTSSATSLASFTNEAGEPGHFLSGSPGALKSAWWQWTAPVSGFCTVDTLRSAGVQDAVLDTLLAVYTGNAVNSLTQVTANDDHSSSSLVGNYFLSSVTFHATVGTTYRIAVDGFAAGSIDASKHDVILRLRHLPDTRSSRLGYWNITSGSTVDTGLQGKLSLTKTAQHGFTAKFVAGKTTHAFKGVIGPDGYYATAFERKTPAGATPRPPIGVNLDLTGDGTLQVKADNFRSTTSFPEVANFKPPTPPPTVAGRFSGTLAPGPVEGFGCATLRILPTGAATGSLILPDGTTATFGSALCQTATPGTYILPYYQSLLGGRSFVVGRLEITEAGATDTLLGFYSYLRPPAPVGATFYPAGFLAGDDIHGGTYTPPASGQRALGFLNGSGGAGKLRLPASAGEIAAEVLENLTLATNNTFAFIDPVTRKPSLKLNTATGLVSGSITEPAGVKRSLRGVLSTYLGTVRLRGHAAGSTKNVYFEVVAP